MMRCIEASARMWAGVHGVTPAAVLATATGFYEKVLAADPPPQPQESAREILGLRPKK